MIQPQTAVQLAEALAQANAERRAIRPQGGGTKLSWGNPIAREAEVLSTACLNRVIEHAWADMTVTVEAGCTIASLQAELARHGQRLSCDPLWPDRATIGGILATNDSGVLRLRYGGLRDLIIGITVALPDGTLASSGGKVVKNVAGYDLPKLMTGALGTLGVITQAVFRLHPLPQVSRVIRLDFASLAEAQKRLLEMQSSQMAHSGLAWRGTSLYVLLEGTARGVDDAAQKLGGADDELPLRESLWPGDAAEFDVVKSDIVKFSVLPSQIAETLALMPEADAIVQATGIGHAKLNGADPARIREAVEAKGGSFVLLTPSNIDAWGDPGDALPLMRALKQQFDPEGTLNPGRFAGGI